MAEPYRVLVTGSREFDDEQAIYVALDQVLIPHGRDWPMVLVHGACPKGADRIAARWAARAQDPYRWPVTAEPHPADWDGYGKRAGFVRNAEMVALGANLALAFYKQGAGNKGTDHCAKLAEAAGIPVRRIMG